MVLVARLIDQVLGHKNTWDLLQRQLINGRVPHALVFSGPAGIGKKQFAWAFAQSLVCEAEARPCGLCPSCKRVAHQSSESVLFLEPEKGAHKLEVSTQIAAFLNLRRISRARVVILEEAQLLNPQASNALLKLVEEPPEQTFLLLTVSELSQLMPTLRSRVQTLRMNPLSEAEIQQGRSAPAWMLRSARGSFEKLALFLDSQSETLRQVSLDFLEKSCAGQRAGLEAVLDQTKDRDSALLVLQFIQQMLRDWALIDSERAIHSDLQDHLKRLPTCTVGQRLELWRKAFQLELDFKAHVDRTLLFENFYHRICAEVA